MSFVSDVVDMIDGGEVMCSECVTPVGIRDTRTLEMLIRLQNSAMIRMCDVEH